MYFKRSRAAFTLIELLVVIAIIAILAVVVVLTLNPAELLRQSRDANRVSDLSTLNSALGLYQTDRAGGSIGTSSVVYVSVPDPAATTTAGTNCATMGMPSMPGGYSWNCGASSTYRNNSGSGWIPVSFTSISSGAPFGSIPVDPVNQVPSGLYYTYTMNGTRYELTAEMESQKYGPNGSGNVESTDGGQYANLYEQGTNLTLAPIDFNPNGVPAFVQTNAECGSISGSFSSSVKKGDLIIDAFKSETNTQPVPADTLGTSFGLKGSEVLGSSNFLWIFAGIAPSGGTDSISNSGGGSWPCTGLMEVSGLTGTVNASAIAYGGSSPNTVSITVPAGTFIYGAIGGYHDANTFTSVAGFTYPAGGNANGSDAIGQEYTMSWSAGSYTAGFNIGGAGADNSPLVVLGFK